MYLASVNSAEFWKTHPPPWAVEPPFRYLYERQKPPKPGWGVPVVQREAVEVRRFWARGSV
eukprot:scaffold3600_cov171-Amphora_coffeaeformis.AAC.12